jgi:hypothetical protein
VSPSKVTAVENGGLGRIAERVLNVQSLTQPDPRFSNRGREFHSYEQIASATGIPFEVIGLGT